MSSQTASKILFTGENTHPELLARVDQAKLPKLYGGLCECKASCIYSNKGPWTSLENKTNYQNKKGSSDEIKETGGNVLQKEEFKFEDDDDDEELMDRRGDEQQFADLKNAIEMSKYHYSNLT